MFWTNCYLKVLTASFLFVLLNVDVIYPYVFIYKVVSDNKTFITASKLSVDAFVMYNGGKDIIKKIKILDIYVDRDFSKAIEDYELKPANVREVPYEQTSDNNTDYAPFIWWR